MADETPAPQPDDAAIPKAPNPRKVTSRHGIGANAARKKQADREARSFGVKVLRLSDLVMRYPSKPQSFYAKELEVSPSSICKLLPSVYEYWRAQISHNAEQWALIELNRINDIYEKASYGWEQSIKQERHEQTTTGFEFGNREVHHEDPTGDPRFLKIMLECSAAICKLTGANKDKGGTGVKEEDFVAFRNGVMLEVQAAMDKALRDAHPEAYAALWRELAGQGAANNIPEPAKAGQPRQIVEATITKPA